MTCKAILRGILPVAWIFSALAVLSTVFVVAPDLWNGTVTGKYLWFFYAQAVFAALTALFLLFRSIKIRLSGLDIILLLFIAYCSAYHLARSDGYEIKFYLLLFLGAFYMCIRILLQHVKSARTILPVFLVAVGLVESVVGLRQLYGFDHSHHGLYRITGDFFNPGPFSGFVALTVPLAVYYAFSFWEKAEARFQQIRASFSRNSLLVSVKQAVWHEENVYILTVGISILNIVAALLVIPAAMSRSAWLAIIAGGLVVLAIRYGLSGRAKAFFQRNRKRAVLIAIAAIGLAAVGFAGLYNLKRGSADGRLFLWEIAAEVIKENPLSGVGLGNFAGAYGQAQYDYFVRGVDPAEAMTADSPAYAFNEFIQIGVEQGLIGLALFLIVVFIAVRHCLRDREKAGILGSATAVLVFALTSYPFSILPVCIGFVVLLALSNREQVGWEWPKFPSWAAAVLLVGGCICFAAGTGPLRQAYRSWWSLSLNHASKYNDTTQDFQEVKPYLDRYQDFMFSYGQALGKMERYQESNEILLIGTTRSSDPMFYNLIGNNYRALGEAEKAEEYYWKAYYTLPNRHYPFYLLAKLYHETGQDEKARSMARQILDKEPKVMSTAIREMQDYARKILCDQKL